MQLSALGIFLILILLIFGVDYYAFTGIRSIITEGTPLWRRIVWGLYASTSLVSLAAIVLLMVFVMASPSLRLYQIGSTLLSWTMAFFLAKLIMVLFLFGHDFLMGGLRLWEMVSGGDAEAEPSPSRRKFIATVGLTVATLPLASMAYGILKGKYDYRLHRLDFSHPDLPEAFDGFKVVQLSDIHSGSFDDLNAVQRGIALAMDQQPDLILFTGDLINREPEEFDPCREAFAQLDAPFGMFATLGNHDYPDHKPEDQRAGHMQQVQDHHAAVGFRLLNNENVRLEKDGQYISLIGVENWGEPPFPQRGDLDRAALGTEQAPFRLLMSHDPTHWDHKVLPHQLPIHLTLSGHTHGMQFGVETKGFKWSPVKYRYPRWAGRYDQDGQTLYVNRGFGFIGFSGRVGIWPEVTLITLRKG